MECYKIEKLNFTYPKGEKKALDNINLTINNGEFITICGKSGCGKTTLLRLLKPALEPLGERSGTIHFKNQLLSETDFRTQTSDIGFVLQNPDNQIVTDKVWHELAFGLESLGYKTPEIRTKVSEMASFFGIEAWFYKNVCELSGGQKQLLNLASVMIMQPEVLILDEPTSQLDPIAAQEFIKILEKINHEFGTTIILSEHRLEEAFCVSNRVIVMDNGKIIADSSPKNIGTILNKLRHDMFYALPTPIRVFCSLHDDGESPITVGDGRIWLENFSKRNTVNNELIPKTTNPPDNDTIIEIKEAYFRYEKNSEDVIKGLSLKVHKGEFFAILGGNGTGKTTMLSLISGLNTPQRGKVLIKGENPSDIKNLYNGILGVLPQNPQALFVKKTVYLELSDMLSDNNISDEDAEERIKNVSSLCGIEHLLTRHPYDLSGGEQQRTALAKILLLSPQILLLDEPTKGMDAHFKDLFANILTNLKANGITIVMVSHDIEFCAKFADRCALFFNGNITSTGSAREFFSGNNFYTTSANRMARKILPDAVITEDIIRACGGIVKQKEKIQMSDNIIFTNKEKEIELKRNAKPKRKLSVKRIIGGIIFLGLFILLLVHQTTDMKLLPIPDSTNVYASLLLQAASVVMLSCALIFFFPRYNSKAISEKFPKRENKPDIKKIISILFPLVAIPITIFIGTYFMKDRNYYLISIIIIIETIAPFLILFEGKKPHTRELILISVLCAIGVVGRSAFFMLPQFKPVVAILILTGVCFGAETGFLVGAITGFVSNFFFGQGPWTPWQMLALGIVGFTSGIFFKIGILKKTRLSLCIFGGLAAFVLYGGIMNFLSVIMSQTAITPGSIISIYLSGAPFDLIHAISTIFFLWFISEPVIDKLERVKKKYGLMNNP